MVALLKRGAAVASIPVSPERAALAAAIDNLNDLQRQLGKAEEIADSTSRAVWAATEEINAAESALSKAEAAAPAHAISVAMGETGAAPQSVPDARADLLAAKERLAAAETLRDGIGVRKREIEGRLSIVQMRRTSAVQGVLQAEAGEAVARLADAIADLLREIVDKGGALEALLPRQVGEPPWLANSLQHRTRDQRPHFRRIWTAQVAEEGGFLVEGQRSL